MNTYQKLACQNADQLIFGKAPKPIPCRNGMIIGGGLVYPEINFTLPPMNINDNTDTAEGLWEEVKFAADTAEFLPQEYEWKP